MTGSGAYHTHMPVAITEQGKPPRIIKAPEVFVVAGIEHSFSVSARGAVEVFDIEVQKAGGKAYHPPILATVSRDNREFSERGLRVRWITSREADSAS